MKKEIIIAILVGSLVGLVITYGMYRASQAVKRAVSNTTTIDASTNPLDTASPDPEHPTQKDGLNVTEPADNLLSADTTIHVSGKTYPNSAIEVLTTAGEIVGMSDATGTFSLAISLNPGANILIIRSQDNIHPQQELTRSVIYSTADLSASSAPDATSTPSASPKAKKAGGTPTP